MPRAFLVRKGPALHCPWKPDTDDSGARKRKSTEDGVESPDLSKEEDGIFAKKRNQENKEEEEKEEEGKERGPDSPLESGVPSRVSWLPLQVVQPPTSSSCPDDHNNKENPSISEPNPNYPRPKATYTDCFTSATTPPSAEDPQKPTLLKDPTASAYYPLAAAAPHEAPSDTPNTPTSSHVLSFRSSPDPTPSLQNTAGNVFATKIQSSESLSSSPPTSAIQETVGNNVIAAKVPRLESLTGSSPTTSLQDTAGNVLATQVPRLESLTSSPGLLNVDSAVGEDRDHALKNVFPSPFQTQSLRDAPSKHAFVIPPSSLPLSPAGRESFYPSSQHMFSSPPPGIVRPVPTAGLPWPIQPIPLRVPMGLRPNFGLCAVTSPEEVPSPPGSSVADMPTSPILGLKSGLASLRAYGFIGEMEMGVDVNNNSSSNNHSGGGGAGGVGGGVGGVRCGSELLSGGSRRQSFKEFLETAKVRVETINDGNGLKNPLLSPDSSRLALDSGPLSFMTLDSFPACPVCGLKCDTPRLLQRHVRSHKEIKRYLCAWCGKGFNDTFDLKRHTRTHTGVRPYKCDSCGKAFTQRCSLESHCRKIHGQILPFTFNERRTKLYVCEECGHSTPSLDFHFEHLRAQHPGHPALERPHHDRRQFKFCGGGGEDDSSDAGVDVVGEGDEGEWKEGRGGEVVEGEG